MSATNHTTNYELPIFVGSDKPAWLVDWNGAMTAIDTAIHTAEGKADQAGTDIGGIESSISTINSTLSSINNAVSQLRIDTNANTGSITTITELIGNGTPTTTDKTLIGAINEIYAKLMEFDLSDYGDVVATLASGATGTLSTYNACRHALNSQKSVGKIYGYLGITNLGVTIGSSGYADILDLDVLVKAPGEQYYINLGGANTLRGTTYEMGYNVCFHIKADGHVSLAVKAPSGTVISSTSYFINLPPCIYFFSDFGD